MAPHHRQLAEQLLTEIAEGTYAVGDRLPTEDELCATSGLSRGTVRNALARLEQLGMISRRPRLGTTVISATPVSGYHPVAESATDIAAFAAETRIVRPETGEIRLGAGLARRLGARSGTTWSYIKGVRTKRLRGAGPLCWSEHYLRAGLPSEKLFSGDFTAEDVQRFQIEQTISGGLIDEALAGALNAEPGSAALVITRRNRDDRGSLLSVGIHTHPADRYSITTTF